jgi:hypothetical protein
MDGDEDRHDMDGRGIGTKRLWMDGNGSHMSSPCRPLLGIEYVQWLALTSAVRLLEVKILTGRRGLKRHNQSFLSKLIIEDICSK